MIQSEIGQLIVRWFDQQGRDLPWRETKNPYEIWIAEIVLQQTRIAQGIQYYYRFIERFPDVFTLAEAELDEVLKYWEGLGYYSRARNLHSTGKYIVSEFNGKFPEHYSELLKLKGIGPYTARAIGSFAFGNQTGVIDGNVLRVMSRFLGSFEPINDGKTRKIFQEIIDKWVANVDPRKFNHGVMDIGATICSPQKPACLICPLQEHCVAYREGLTQHLPVKKKTLKRTTRYFYFYLVQNKNEELAIQRRPESGLWGGLWEIPNEEISYEPWQQKIITYQGQFLTSLKHVFTHFDMMIKVYLVKEEDFINANDMQFISTDKISNFAFSKAVLKIFSTCFEKLN